MLLADVQRVASLGGETLAVLLAPGHDGLALSLTQRDPMDDDGSATRTQRPVTSHSLGAKARYVAAVGALADADAE